MGNILIDPGPVFGRRRLERYVRATGGITAIFATHCHEEHVGNVPLASKLTGAMVYGTDVTLHAVRSPERLSLPRRVIMGQPEPELGIELRRVEAMIETPRIRLSVIESSGHCAGHASLFDAERGVLFAGDSFLHTVFTAPNKDVSSMEWIATLRRYGQLHIETLVGTHGCIYSCSPRIPPLPFVVTRLTRTK